MKSGWKVVNMIWNHVNFHFFRNEIEFEIEMLYVADVLFGRDRSV